MIVQCMGGWCVSREKCAHYSATKIPGRMPVERLCGPVEQPELMMNLDADKVKAYDRHMALSRAHATVAQAIRYPMLVNAQALRTARALIEASHVLDRQMSKPESKGN